MPPVLRLWQGASRGSQVEAPDAPPQFHRPAARKPQPPVLVLDPAKLRPEGFTYHGDTTAVVSETPDFVEVSDGPPGSGLTMGERRALDGTWTETFVHQRGAPAASGPPAEGGGTTGKGGKAGKGKGKGSARPRDFGRRIGTNLALGQRWKETWERQEDVEAAGVRTRVERHVQQVDNVDTGEAAVRQEWDEDEEGFEALGERGGASAPAAAEGPEGAGSAAAASSCASSSSGGSPPPASAGAPGAGQVERSHTWRQKGKDRQTGRVWTRTVTRRKVRHGDEVLSESEEECLEREVNGEERGTLRKRVGRSVETSEWGSQPGGNRWRSSYSLQTLVNEKGETCGREWVEKWYDNGEEEQTEEWETLDEFEHTPSTVPSDGGAGVAKPSLRLKRRIRSGKKDGRKRSGQFTEWHERWEEQELPATGPPGVGGRTLRLRRKKLEKSWCETACNNAWGEHQIEDFDENESSERVEQRKWYDNGHERQDESWTEHPDGTAEGTKEGRREGQTWGENWRRTCAGEEGVQTVDKWHDDGLGTKVESKEKKKWKDSKDVEWHREELGERVGRSDKWTVKLGGNATGDEWYEAWSEKQAEKSAEKRGKNARGDEWKESWTEEYNAEGVRIRQRAEKAGSNAQGDQWYENWIEEQERKKSALKRGKNAQGAEWQEEWGEEASPDGSGSKWTCKWADDGSGGRWGDNWGDEWAAGGDGGKRWVEKWDNKGKSEKHSHATEGRPKH